jgi:hypothetical protein
VGTLKFFCKDPKEGKGVGTGDLGSFGQDPKDPTSPWGVGLWPQSGRLPSTIKPPPWWNLKPIEGPATRTFSMWWCCCNTKDDFCISQGTPTALPGRPGLAIRPGLGDPSTSLK